MKMKSKQGEMVVTYTKSGLKRYKLEIRHDGLHKYRDIRGDDASIVQQKARTEMAKWDKMWEQREAKEQKAAAIQNKKDLATEKTEEAQENLTALEKILSHTLEVDDKVDWESLKNKTDYPIQQPKKNRIPIEPQKTDSKYQVKLSIIDRIFASKKLAKEKQAEEHFSADHAQWQTYKEKAETTNASELANWIANKDSYLEKQVEENAAIEAQKNDYLAGKDSQAIVDYCDLVLSNSQYPDYFPQSYELDFNLETKLLVVDYQLPPISEIPTLKEVKYVQSRDDFTEKHVSQAQLNRTYDTLLYQIALRTIHELYEADQIKAIEAIVFNGYVNSIDPATGQQNNSCILSLQAGKEEFEIINLSLVEPKACFKKLKGVSASKLSSLTPVAPLMKIERDDSRFVSSYDVAESIQGENLAAMDWEDFEHLIRELFEQEFSSSGGEVKVTRASRDGGIDAVVFDPDPIRGGKIVIQAKRYTNTVGISAVRDLYGTLMNEGANKGILVTTADYGPDAHSFARGKPITLINGNELLFLLEKHGHKARIDTKEAKLILADKNKN